MASIQLPPEFIERLRRAAAAEGKSVPEFISAALDAYAARENAKAKGDPIPPEAEPKGQ